MRKEKILKNSRIIPVSKKYISDKNFNMEVYIKLMLMSKKNNEIDEIHRYIYLEEINYKQWSKEISISVNSIKKYLKHLINIKILKPGEFNDNNVYKIKGKYEDEYLLFETNFLTKLLQLNEKNLIKLYFIYYKYSKLYGTCKIKQEDLLSYLGYSTNSKKNFNIIKNLNSILEEIELIKKSRFFKKSKWILEIQAPLYYLLRFYKTDNFYTNFLQSKSRGHIIKK